MKFFLAILLAGLWSVPAIGEPSSPEMEVLTKADSLLVKGQLEDSEDLIRSLLPKLDNDPLLRGMAKMAILHLKLKHANKARVYVSNLQIKLLGKNTSPFYILKLAASYLQAERYEEANATLDHLVSTMPLYQKTLAADIKMIQALVDLRQLKKANAELIQVHKKLTQLKQDKAAKQAAANGI